MGMATQYIFGHNGDAMILETIGEAHTDLKGFSSVTVTTDVDVTTHTCSVEKKYRSAEGADGLCYDWYAIRDYYRDTDRTPTLQKQTDANSAAIDDIILSMLEGGTTDV